MKYILIFITIFMCSLSLATAATSSKAYALPAFPGAEGYGSTTPGGRGGKVIEVTNLNESGNGSLRAACEASGPRIVVFRTGGTIKITRDISIRNPYITIAGQSAPGDGIMIRGGAIRIHTHDVIIRGLRIRVGDGSAGTAASNRDGISIENRSTPPHNIIIDHCSISWALDENTVTWYKCHDITFQWNIIAEGLRGSGGGYGLLIGDHASRISVHHNFFAHNADRNPRLKGDTESEIVNNVIYNWDWYATRLNSAVGDGPDSPSRSNIIGNHYIPGPNTGSDYGITVQGSDESKVFVEDNVGPGKPSNRGDEWALVYGSGSYRSSSHAVAPSGIKVDDVSDLPELVIQKAGATPRDSVDARLVKDMQNGKGRLINSQNDVGGWPSLDRGDAPDDADHDGMPDSWEEAQGLDPDDATDGKEDLDGDGYTNVEEYLNGLIVMASVGNPQNPPDSPANLKVVSY